MCVGDRGRRLDAWMEPGWANIMLCMWLGSVALMREVGCQVGATLWIWAFGAFSYYLLLLLLVKNIEGKGRLC